mgnify:CR=1 FL=1
MKKILYFLCLSILVIFPLNVSAKVNLDGTINLLTTDKIITDIDEEEATDESYVTCTDDIYIPYQIVSVVRVGISFIKIGVPIIFIIMGMLDFGKVVLGKPDKEMDKAKKSFGYRLISAILVFLVVSIVEMVLPLITTEDKILNCTKCLMLDDKHCKYVNISYPTPSPTATPKPSSTPRPTSTPDNTPNQTPESSNTLDVTDNLDLGGSAD